MATYIPELAKADRPSVSPRDSDGMTTKSATRAPFTIQSISKPFVYGLALEDHGREQVLDKVGVEPTGEAFNSIVFDERQQPARSTRWSTPGPSPTTALIGGD